MSSLWRRLSRERSADSAEATQAAASSAAERLLIVQQLLEAAQVAANAEPGTTAADVLGRMIEQVRGAFGARHACIHFARPQALEPGTVSEGVQYCPVGSGTAEAIPRLAGLEQAAMLRARQAGRPLPIAPMREEVLAELALTAGFQDGLVVPVAYQDDAFAWLNIYLASSHSFDEVDQGLLRAVGGVLYGAIKKEAFIAAIQRIRAVLETHFSPQVVDKLISDPESLASQRNGRLDVSVLFSDLRGFTALSERLDPDEVALLISEHLEAMAMVVFQYGGIVDKYIGDSVMAVFGSPFPQPDHPQRAVAAALAMVAVQRDLHARWNARVQDPLAIGIGINSGVAVVGTVGMSRREFTHLGDTVNLASRLKDVAKPWQVLINRSTYERVREQVQADPLEPFAVKGKAEPVNAFEVTAYLGAQEALRGEPSVVASG